MSKIPRKSFMPHTVNHKANREVASQAMQGGKPPVIEREQIMVPDKDGVKQITTKQKYLPNNAPATPKKVKKFKTK